MIHKDNTPTFNVNRRIDTYKDFINNKQKEKEELEKMDRTEIPNSDTNHQIIGNKRHKYNKVSHKIDDISPEEIDDKLDTIKNENASNLEVLDLSTNYFDLKPDLNGDFSMEMIDEEDFDLDAETYMEKLTDYMFTIYERNFKSIIPFDFQLNKGEYIIARNYSYHTDSFDMDLTCDYNELLNWLSSYINNFEFILFIKEYNKSVNGYISFEPHTKQAFIDAINDEIHKAFISVYNYEYNKRELLESDKDEIQNYILENYINW